MPPVRWKLGTVISTICLVQIIIYTDAQHMQDSISMTSDGWRPIIGTRREPYHSEITHYRNPSQNNEAVKAETPSPTSAPVSPAQTPSSSKFTQTPLPANNINPTNRGKIPPHSKYPQYYTLPSHGAHGPHIPIGAVSLSRPSQHGQIKKYPVVNKQHLHITTNGKRHAKPVRVQTTAHSTREEIYAPAPSNSGSYSFFTQGQNTIKTRETPLLNLQSAGTNHYSINQPHSHVEFTNRFAIPPTSENVYKQFNTPLPTFIFPKHPQSNDINYQFQNQNDEYTRNLVPPPIYKKFQEKEQTNKPNNEPQVQVTTLPQFSKPHIPENIIVQLPPPLEQNKFKLPHSVHLAEQAVDVQVTKEKLKVFHNNIPPNYNGGDYSDYEYHSIRKPSELPKLQTYEVTEGKPWQETPPHISSFPEFKPRPRKPQLKRRPEYEFKLSPPFLPTPYKPDGSAPTSPTQSEVSTIFTHLSNLQKGKNEFNTPNPSYFNVKEVSTHYPIIGRPDFATEASIAVHENPEISNEITTNYNSFQTEPPQTEPQPIPTVAPVRTTSTTIRTPLRTRPLQRRRRPVNRVRTTTEEPVAVTESYELQKAQENEASESSETERPYRQKRPNRYRYSTQSTIENEELTTKTTRGRTRHRTRLGNVERSTPSSYRKRIRPTNYEITELPPNHKITENDMELMEYHQHTTESYHRKYPKPQHSYESSSVDEDDTSIVASEEIESLKKQKKFQYELPGRHYQPIEEESQDEITNPVQKYTVNVEEVTIPQSQSSTDQLPTTNLHIPENEVDFTSLPHKELDLDDVDIKENEEDIIFTTLPPTTETTTTTTPIPTTTSTPSTTTTSSTSVKSHRIRGRPIKYDNSNRPKFSVKEYRQRLNQYSTSTTTESYRTTSESLKVRFPNRLRRPISSTSTTTETQEDNNEDTTETVRSKFVPKDPRHGSQKEESSNDPIITEKNIKAVNTRLRPFGRYRSTTVPTSTTTKISIKPNLFSRRRPPPISLRTRIQNKYNKTNTDEQSTDKPIKEENQTELSELVETTLQYNQNIPEEQTTTEYITKKIKNTESPINDNTDSPVTDILKNESFMYSQRVSDLTSSSKNDYNTPGIFKSVPPTSRRIPSYFTIATDDPILPIEAFFPNIKDKEKDT